MKRLETLYELLTKLPYKNEDLIICITPQSRKELIKEIKAFEIIRECYFVLPSMAVTAEKHKLVKEVLGK